MFLWLTVSETLADLFWGPLHFLAFATSSTMTKWCENSSPVVHLGRTYRVMPYFGCRQHQEMGRQSSPSVGGLVQQHQSRTWEHDVLISSLCSVLSSQGREIIVELCMAAGPWLGDHGLSCKAPKVCPKWALWNSQDTPLCKWTPVLGWGRFSFLTPHGHCSRTCWHGHVRVYPRCQTYFGDSWCAV